MKIGTKLRSMQTYSSSSSFIVHLLIWMQTIHLQWPSGCLSAKANGVSVVGDGNINDLGFGFFFLFFGTHFIFSFTSFHFPRTFVPIHSFNFYTNSIQTLLWSSVDRTTPAAISGGSFLFYYFIRFEIFVVVVALKMDRTVNWVGAECRSKRWKRFQKYYS